jgi:hypothetical protein
MKKWQKMYAQDLKTGPGSDGGEKPEFQPIHGVRLVGLSASPWP